MKNNSNGGAGRPDGLKSQFEQPHGLLGWVAGLVLATTTQERSETVLALLNLQSNDRVLEIGFGPGADIARVSKIVTEGFVAGIDPSDVMVQQARIRNATAIRAGKVEVRQAAVSDKLPYPDHHFSKIFSINSFQFWPNPIEELIELQRMLQEDGLIVIALQPRTKGATNATAEQEGPKMVEKLRAAGFQNVRLEIKPIKPIAVACALAEK